MIKVSVMYPYKEGAKFDIDYYCERHMPMVRQTLGTACKGIAAEKGIGGAAPGTPPAYVAMGHILFDSILAFQTAFGAHASTFMADVPNYTSIEPLIQVSEVRL